jgi:protein kinase
VTINFEYSWFSASMNHGRTTRGVLDSTEKLANMTLGPRRQYVGQQPCPPPMKAGVKWNSGSGDMLLRPAKDIQQGRTYARKVVG